MMDNVPELASLDNIQYVIMEQANSITPFAYQHLHLQLLLHQCRLLDCMIGQQASLEKIITDTNTHIGALAMHLEKPFK